MSDDKLQHTLSRGARADLLLKDELLKQAFSQLEKDYVDAWRQTSARDTDGRERLWQAVNVVRKVHDHLIKVLNDGKLAQRELVELAARNLR
jgi:hypothetical protein